ncbi:MAG: ABC transporter ATP-binding protein [Candidatus Eutrophobiaceae bacterium]
MDAQSAAQPSSTSALRFDWDYIAKIVRTHRHSLIRAHILAIFATSLSVPVPLLMPLLVDEVLLNQPGALLAFFGSFAPHDWQTPMGWILLALSLTITLRTGALCLNVAQTRYFTIIAKDLVFQIRSTLLHKLQHTSMFEYETRGSGGIASRLVTDLETIDQFISASVSQFLVATLTLIGISAILLLMHWQIAILILFANPLVIYATMQLGKRVKELKKNQNLSFEIFQQSLTETLDSIHQIRAANRDRHYLKILLGHAKEVRRHGIAHTWQSDMAKRLSFAIFLFGFDTFRAIAMIAVLSSDLTIGKMFAFFGYLWFMMTPVQEILNIQYALYAAKAALARVNKLLEMHEEPHWPHVRNPFSGHRGVELCIQGLHFSYDGAATVLRDIDLLVPAGEKVALVGESGAGKSTLVQLLIGLYTPTKGQILYGDAAMNVIGLDTIRENVATVLQHPFLFNSTIRQNLDLGRGLSDARLWDALEIAQLKDTVERLERGLDSLLGRQGVRFSGGQRQRLAIARMILGDPKIVILDEATSALDAVTEFRLHNALDAFLEGRTTLIIAHRLSSIKRAQMIYVFEDGRISEQGGHHDLLARDSLYSQLYGAHQASCL